MFYGHHVCSQPAGPYVVGVDAGGTHTRAAIMTLDGVVAGYGVGPGANPNSGGDTADEPDGRALTTALTDLDPARSRAASSASPARAPPSRPRAVAAANAAWQAAGIAGEPDVVTDIAVAFAAGSTEPAGIVIFAGTGAGAAVINDGEIERRADANG